MVSRQLLAFIDRCQIFALEFDLGARLRWEDLEGILPPTTSFTCPAERIVASDVLRRVRAHLKRRTAGRPLAPSGLLLATVPLKAPTNRQHAIVKVAVTQIAANYQNPDFSAARLAQDTRVSRWDLGRA